MDYNNSHFSKNHSLHCHVICLHFVQFPIVLFPQYPWALAHHFARFNYCTKMAQIKLEQGKEEFFFWLILFLLWFAGAVCAPRYELGARSCAARALAFLQAYESTESPRRFQWLGFLAAVQSFFWCGGLLGYCV